MHQHTGEALHRSGSRQRESQPIVHAFQDLRRRVPELPLAVREELHRARRHPGRPVQVNPIAETAGAELYFRQMARQPRAGIGNRPLSGRVRIGPFQQRQVERYLRLLGQAQVLADQVMHRATQADLPRSGQRVRRRHGHRQQHFVLVAVGHHRR